MDARAMKLTDEQIEKAAEAARIAYYREVPSTPWKDAHHTAVWRKTVRAAAPFLQMPLAEPSEEEIVAVVLDLELAKRADAQAHTLMAQTILSRFIFWRNAPPSDPRREKIAELLDGSIMNLDQVDQLTDSILAIVDKEKP